MSISKISVESYRSLPRRRFTKEFKREVVERLLNSNLTVAQLAREHAIHPNQLCRWRQEYLHGSGPSGRDTEALRLLPIAVVPQAEARQTATLTPTYRAPGNPEGEVGLRIALAKGDVVVLNGCVPELLRATIEALQ